MSTTMRVSLGRKVKNPKYLIRRTAKVHLFEENGSTKLRVSGYMYMGKPENEPKETSNEAYMEFKVGDSTRGIRVSIS